MTTPYFERDGITIYHGDARDILPTLPVADAIVTDPVWPNAISALRGSDDPAKLFAEVMRLTPGRAERIVVHLGVDSDPRFLAGVPDAFPYLRACWLRFARPHHKGRVLYGSDVAYVFGSAPLSQPGQHLMPGEFTNTDSTPRITGHPCPRRIQHVQWLVKWFARGLVVDPFVGSGTTLRAARLAGFPATGIEIEERYCEVAAKSLEQLAMDLEGLAS